jgi:hypothetical protein
MPLEQLANIAEIFGMLVISITLIFLIAQMRQNNKALHSSTAYSAHEQVGNQMYRPLASDHSLADVFLRGCDDPSGLSPVETVRFFAFFQNTVFTIQTGFYQWREGALDEAFWISWSKIITNIHTSPGFRLFWEQRKYLFTEDFQSYCETELFSRQPTPGYRPLGATKE